MKGITTATWNRVVRTGFTKKMLFGLRLDGSERFISTRAIWEKSSPDSDESMPGAWVGSLLVSLGNSRKAKQLEQSQQGGDM